MISIRSLWNGLKVVSLLLAFCALAGQAMQKTEAGKSSDTPVTLTYQFPEGKALAYRQSGTETQNLEMMGQSMTSQTQSSIEFTAKQKGLKDGQFTLGITINALKIDSSSPQGDVSADTSSVLSKSFDMILSRLGKEIDTSGAAAIKYEFGSTGTRDLSGRFQSFFPDLPDRPVKTGDTWPSEDAVTQKVGSGELRITTKNVHTLDGFETVDGFECARIKTAVKGTLTGNLEQGGVGLSLDCTMEGSETWYFAIKEGMLIKSDSKGSIGGNLALGDPVNSTIPIGGETHEETRLIQK
ncbi:MAG: hypothetical protein LAP85_12270 [Acidobacteriia bacterium]|nr:hypothetical protein [Terriglobia bacterium]